MASSAWILARRDQGVRYSSAVFGSYDTPTLRGVWFQQQESNLGPLSARRLRNALHGSVHHGGNDRRGSSGVAWTKGYGEQTHLEGRIAKCSDGLARGARPARGRLATTNRNRVQAIRL